MLEYDSKKTELVGMYWNRGSSRKERRVDLVTAQGQGGLRVLQSEI